MRSALCKCTAAAMQALLRLLRTAALLLHTGSMVVHTCLAAHALTAAECAKRTFAVAVRRLPCCPALCTDAFAQVTQAALLNPGGHCSYWRLLFTQGRA